MNPITEKFCPKCQKSLGCIPWKDARAQRWCDDCVFKREQEKQNQLTSCEKLCTGCNITQSKTEFHKNKNSKDGLQSKCKKCNKANFKESYLKDSSINIAAVARWTEKNKLSNQTKVWNYLLEHPCLHCGEADPVVLEFDHIDPSTKFKAIAMLKSTNCSWTTLENEMKKCQVLCANCHRRKTARELGHHKRFIDWDNH
jgi:hypothetical protein